MNMRTYMTGVTVIIICCAAAFSKGKEQRHTDEFPSVFSAKEKATIDDMVAILEKNRSRYVPEVHLSSLDIYTDALGRINAARPVVEKKPGAPAAIASMQACSLMTEAAVLQMKIVAGRRQIDSIGAKHRAVAEELGAVYDEISDFEKSRASKLRSELDDKQRRLDEERRKADKLRAEAEKKFSELQSALIRVSTDARGTIISMSDILFETNKANLTPDCRTNLAKIAGILIVFKDSKVIIEGHTDNTGTREYNQKLSEARAENVMNFLIEQGVESERLTAVGYGMGNPIADNGTKEGRQKNRRVDLIVQEKKVEAGKE